MRDVLHEILVSAGYDVVDASSGARALEAMTERAPDLVITDLLMPGMSGFSLRAAMLRRPDLAHVPVIVLSGYWQRPGETLEAVEALPKPLSVDRLLASVRRATNGADERTEPVRASGSPEHERGVQAAESERGGESGVRS